MKIDNWEDLIALAKEELNEELAKMKNKVASLNAKYKGMINAMNN